MLMPDVNILIYAHRTDALFHQAYHQWWNAVVNADKPFALSTQVAVGFVRIVTQPKMPGGPTPLVGALAFIDDIIARPNCRLMTPESDHWQRTAVLCRSTDARGKHVADAQHAAMAIASGCTWVTRDQDFSRFIAHGLEWQHLVL
jgi:toxin-antitoxin system PIN domain toxin